MTLLEHAINYARGGFEILPLKPDKTPYVSQYLATTNASLVDKWFEEFPDVFIGCRIPEDELVLDIDPRHGGDKTWGALLDEFGTIPAGRSHRSGRGDGGMHVWLTRPDGPIRESGLNSWAKDHGTGEQAHKRDGTLMETRPGAAPLVYADVPRVTDRPESHFRLGTS